MKKIFLALLVMLALTGCVKGKKNDSELVSFLYSYGSGMGTYYSYDIHYNDEGKLILTKYHFYGHDSLTEKEIDKKVLVDIKKIIDENEIYKWNGFDKSNNTVMDGSGFNIEFTYKDGTSFKAHGYMMYPDNYNEKVKPLQEYLSSIE